MTDRPPPDLEPLDNRDAIAALLAEANRRHPTPAAPAVRAVDDDGDPLLEVPARLKWRRSGRNAAELARKLVEDAVAVFQCDPLDLVVEQMADVRYYADADGPWLDIEVVVTTVHELGVAATNEANRGRLYRLAREAVEARAAHDRARDLADGLNAVDPRLAARNRLIAQERGR